MRRVGRDRAAVAAVGAGVVVLATGAWAFFHPRSFYDAVATYPPYNEHFLHDAGSFLLGLGAALVLAARLRSGLAVALAANAVAAVFHAISHVLDRADGGRASDPYLLGLFAVALAALAWRRARSERAESSRGERAGSRDERSGSER